MRNSYLRAISFILVLAMMLSLSLTSCNLIFKDKNNQNDGGSNDIGNGDENNNGGSSGYTPPEDEYTIPKEDGYNQLTFYWSHPGVIENCDIWCWWDGKEGSGYEMHPCAYGAKVVINVPVGIDQVGFIVRTDCSDPGGSSWGQATKDATDEDRFAIIDSEETYIYLKSGDPAQYTSNDGGNTLTMIKKFTLAGMIDFHRIHVLCLRKFLRIPRLMGGNLTSLFYYTL